MRSLLISLFIIFFFNACTLSTTKNLVKISSSNTLSYTNNYFSDLDRDYIYKANITVYGNDFGGIMIIKKLKQKHHRIVFTTEFGNKIFDFELNNNTFKVNFILEELDKKILINTLKRDFKMILKEESKVYNTYKNSEQVIYQTLDDKKYNFYFVNATNNSLEKLVHTTKTKEKVIVNFENTHDKLANNLSIEHLGIQLKINLKYFSNN